MARRPSVNTDQHPTGSYLGESAGLQYLGYKTGTDDHQVTLLTSGDTAGTVIVGVAQFDFDIGEWVTLALGGITMVRCIANVTLDDPLECVYSATTAYDGGFQTISGALAAGYMIAGYALEDGAQYEYIAVRLCLHKQVATS